MKRLVLTSTGFDNDKITKRFLKQVAKEPVDLHVLFVPTAANDDEARAVLPKCMSQLLNMKIPESNIQTYNLDYCMSYEELKQYDAIYFTGGSPKYLLEQVNKVGFSENLIKYTENNGIYIGVSAGSMIATNNYQDGLKLVNCRIGVHCILCSKPGKIELSNNPDILIGNMQALIVEGDNCELIE